MLFRMERIDVAEFVEGFRSTFSQALSHHAPECNFKCINLQQLVEGIRVQVNAVKAGPIL